MPDYQNQNENDLTAARTDDLFQEKHFDVCRSTDRLFVALMVVQWIGGIVAALIVSPNTWIGTTSEVHLHVWAAMLLGGIISSLPVFLGLTRAGQPQTRHVIATAQVLWCGLLIHLTGGRIETHFYLFVSFAFLSFYREWRLLIIPTIIAAADHIIRGFWWPESVYGVFVQSPFRWIEHAAWLLLEVGILASCCQRIISEMYEVAERQAQLESTNRCIEDRIRERTHELSVSEARLSSSEARLQSMLDSMLDPMITVNTQGIIQAATRSVKAGLGWQPDDLIGQNIDVLLPELSSHELNDQLNSSHQTGASNLLSRPQELQVKCRDDTRYPAFVTLWRVDLPDQSEPLIMGTIHDITEEKQREEELERLNQQLVEAAREAGQSEIATNVLHNVGNVLNSVNVSVGMFEDRIHSSQVASLNKAIDIMEQHLDDLGQYVTQDERGKHLPQFLIDVSRKIATDEEELLSEVNSLRTSVDHIKTVVAAQQAYATGMSGFIEQLSLADMLEDALQINAASMTRHAVRIVRQFDDIEPLLSDRQKLLQIVVNLINNAKQACDESGHESKQVTISLRRTDEDHAVIEVRDNGMGIARENLTRIFAHGFSTRKEGHGFGLHSSVLAAEELGATLIAASDGPGKGAVFTLSIPYQTQEVTQCAP